MLQRLWPFCRPYRWRWAISILASMASVSCGLMIPRLIGWTVDDLRAGPDRGARLPFLALGIVAASSLYGFFLVLMRRVGPVAARRVGFDLRCRAFSHLTSLDRAWFARQRAGDVINRFDSDIQAVQDVLGFGLVGAVNIGLTTLGTLALLIRTSAPLGIPVALAFPVVLGGVVIGIRSSQRRYLELQQRLSALSAKVQETLAHIREIRACGVEAMEEAAFTTLQKDYQRCAVRLRRTEEAIQGGLTLLLCAGVSLVLFLAAPSLLGGDRFGSMTLGSFVTFITYLVSLLGPLYDLGQIVNTVQRGRVSWTRVQELLGAEPAIKDGAGRPLSRPVRGELRFENVSLVLGGRTLLEGVSFALAPGRIVGLTGSTGAGKSLVAALAARVLDPTEGRILLDGRDLRELPLSEVRGAIALVEQEPLLFSQSVRGNIALYAGEANVERAARIAEIAAEIERMPRGYDTLLGERGITVSGGQRQRLALARALATERSILVLDDALAAVDTETEVRILHALKEVLSVRSGLVIAHRLSTLQVAHEVLVLQAGRIIERGSHDTLLASGGHYAALAQRQSLLDAIEVPRLVERELIR